MRTWEIKYLTVLAISIVLAFAFGWAAKTEALLGLIYITLAYILRVLCEILENIKDYREKIEKEKEQWKKKQ
ncbi:MAG: hypothetical protein LBK58_09070 [Prevotellaceae bacterium]|jgi:hypothetical protein|nr:hypothetical protein [Prevotellaceae bacterium]